MALPPQFLDELRTRLTLSDLVMKRMRLQRAGREWKAPCPFHREKTPSFYVNDGKGFFHCFGCGAHGDVIGFVMRHDNLSFPETVELLAAEAGMQVPKASPEEHRRFERQKSLYDLLEAATRYYEAQLFAPGGRAALSYLRGRGLDDDTLARFRLGYAPQDGGPLRAELLKQGFSESDLVEAALFRRPDDGRAPFAFFRHRVLFPVSDRRGRVVAFGGRLIEGDGPKYVNSSDNPLFHKGQLLYGMSRARQAAADGAPLIVTEGYMDVIACHVAGFGGAVAPLGTALTEAQIETLWKLAPEGRRTPVLCFDGDNAGRRAALRAIERLLPMLQPDHSARVAFMPEKEDPDSLIRQGGAAAFQAVLDRARPLADVLWESEAAGRDLAIPDHRAGLEAALARRCGEIRDDRVRRAYETDMRDRLFRASRAQARAQARAQRPQASSGGAGAGRRGRPVEVTDAAFNARWRPLQMRSGKIRTADLHERILLTVLLNHPPLFEHVGENLAMMSFQQPRLEALRQEVVAHLSADSALDATDLRVHLSRHGHADVVDDLLSGVTEGYAKPGAPLDAAHEGWLTVYRQLQPRLLEQERFEAEMQRWLAADESAASRSEAIRREQQRLLGLPMDNEFEE
jgi:DNA primase